MKFLLNTNKCHFRWLLHLKKQHYNDKRKRQLEDNGYKFIDITEFTKLRNIDDYHNFGWDRTRKTNEIYQKNNDELDCTGKLNKTNKRKRNKRKRSYSQISKF